MAVLDDTTVAVPALPYRGIQPYRYVDHPIFFEREEETHDLLSLVVVYRGMMLYGDSGAGKSSLINAGLVAGAREKGFQPERIRVYPHDGAELVVERIATTDAGDAFLPSLFALEDDTLPRIVLSTASFEERVHASGPTRPLLVFDQFEELVTLFGASAHADIQRRIVGLLTALLRDASMPVKVLFVFREDYLASVKQLLAAAPELIDQALRLAPPAAEALTTIIRGPFERYPGHFPRELGPEVAERLRAKLADRFGSGEISLSEVQTVCLRLWQSSDPGPLLEARGVQGLLEDYLGEELDAFPPELKYPAVALLSGMVTSAGTRNVISAESLIGHVREEEHEIPEDVLERALDRLESESKLVRRERRRDLYLYEITSEFLVPWINQRRQELIRTRERRRERRRLRLLGAAVVVLLLVVAGVAYLALTAQRSAADARKAEERAKRAAASEASIVLSAAAQQQPDHASDSALLLALAAFEAGKHADASSRAAASREALRTLESVKLSGRLTTLRGHHGQVWSVAFSPDGRTLASGGEDGTLRFWSVRKHQEVGQPQHAATNRVTAGGSPALMSVAYSRNGRVLVTAGNDGTVRFWDARSHKQLPRPIRTSVGFGRTIAFSPDGNTLATAGRDGKLRLWNLRTRRPIRERTLSGPNVLPESIAFSGNGRWLVTAGGGAMELWSVPTLRLIGAIRMGSLGVITVDISADGRTLVTGDARGTVKLWSRRGLRPLGAPLGAPSNQSHSIQLLAVTDVEFSPDGRAVAVAKQDGQIQMWSVSTRRLLHSSFRASTNRVFSISFSRNGRTLASAGGNGLVQLWGLQASAVHGLVIASSRRPFDAAVFSPDGRTIATAGADKTVRLWSTRSPSEIGAPLIGHTRRVWSVAFSPDGETLASAGLDGTIRLGTFEHINRSAHRCLGTAATSGRSRSVPTVGPSSPVAETTRFACGMYRRTGRSGCRCSVTPARSTALRSARMDGSSPPAPRTEPCDSGIRRHACRSESRYARPTKGQMASRSATTGTSSQPRASRTVISSSGTSRRTGRSRVWAGPVDRVRRRLQPGRAQTREHGRQRGRDDLERAHAQADRPNHARPCGLDVHRRVQPRRARARQRRSRRHRSTLGAKLPARARSSD